MKNTHFEQIKEGLTNLGICKGDTILIHSSYKSLGYVEGGIQTLIEAIISQLGDSRNLLIPALSYASVNAMEKPTFDIVNTPTCVGAITEFFRTFDGVKRSMHPTHSVCVLGKNQDELIKNHHLDNEPVGPNSPFCLLPEYGGKVLMLGCGTNPNTSMHGIEEHLKVPYVLSDEPRKYTLIDESGNETTRDFYWHYMKYRGYSQCYFRLENLMEFTKGKILEADCNVIDSPTMWKVASEKIKEDTYYFTGRIEPEKL